MSIFADNIGPLDKARTLFRLTWQRSREGHLPAQIQLAEMLWLKLSRGIGPGYYHVAGLWRRDVPWRDKVRQLGESEYQQRLERLNPQGYRKLSQSKIAEKAILQLFSVPTPKFLGFFHPVSGRTSTGAGLCTLEELAGLLCTHAGRRICFKLVEGWGGAGFQAVEVCEDAGHGLGVTLLSDGRHLPLRAFVAEALASPENEGWVIEQYLEQHERMRTFNPSSVNTMRLWVLRPAAGPARLLGGYLRIGRSGSLVDNQSSGGIIARIDPESGILRAATDGHVDRPEYAVHPDHGAPIAGQTVPCWREATALAERTLPLFPHLRFAGFDVAVSADGPVIIELNVSPDLQGAAEIEIPLASVLDL
jgi:hypothetical protein